jgi:hypothetical protein
MNRVTTGLALAFLAAAAGCSGQADPPQPKLSDEQIKSLMKQGGEQRERGDPRPSNMGPGRPAKPK